MGSQSKRTGRLGEELALRHLRSKGYRLIAANHHIRGGEIDLIVKIDTILVFVEVKTRRSRDFGAPQDALTKRKKQRLLRAIRLYLQGHPCRRWSCDLIAIDILGRRATLRHFHDVLSDL